MLRFHLDENVAFGVAVGLRGRGFDVTTTTDAGLNRASDADQIAFARSQARVVVTHDDDLLILAASGVVHSGIAYCGMNCKSIGYIVRRLTALSLERGGESMIDVVVFL